MSVQPLRKASLVNPVSFDRNSQGNSTVIANDEFYVEANITAGCISDVNIYINRNHAAKTAPNWQWYGAVPAGNIKSYELMAPPSWPESMPRVSPIADGKPETQNQAKPARGANSAAE